VVDQKGPDSGQLVQLQISAAEPFGKAGIRRRQEISGLADAVLIALQSGEAHRSPECPRQSALAARPIDQSQENDPPQRRKSIHSVTAGARV
jgi:hypothetical protein